MFKKQNHNLVLVEKTLDFEKVYSLLYNEACEAPVWKTRPDSIGYKKFVVDVYKNGNLHVLIKKNLSPITNMELLEII